MKIPHKAESVASWLEKPNVVHRAWIGAMIYGSVVAASALTKPGEISLNPDKPAIVIKQRQLRPHQYDFVLKQCGFDIIDPQVDVNGCYTETVPTTKQSYLEHVTDHTVRPGDLQKP